VFVRLLLPVLVYFLVFFSGYKRLWCSMFVVGSTDTDRWLCCCVLAAINRH